MNGKEQGSQFRQTTQVLAAAGPTSGRAGVWPIVWIGLLAVAVRMVTIGRPFAGYFATKSCVYAMIARNWALDRASLWYPTLDCIRGGDRSWHLLEFPCAAYFVGLAWRCFGGSLDVWGRLFSVGWTVGAIVMLYFYVRRHHGQTAAAGAAFALALSPVSVIFGQQFMLEPSLVFFTIATIFTLDTGLVTGHRRWVVLSTVAFALLLLTKIYMVVLLLPIVWMLFVARREKENSPSSGAIHTTLTGPLNVVLFLLATIPAAVWYTHAYHTGMAGSERVYYSVADSAESHRLPHPLWSSPDFYTHTFDDFATVVLTPVGFLLFWLGCFDRGARRHLAWLAVSLLLIMLMPRKFYEMSYYYMAILPPVCIMVGLGWDRLASRSAWGTQLSRKIVFLTGLLAVVVAARYVAGPLLVTVDEDRPVVAAAEAVKRISSPKDRVIAIHATGLDLLYYCDRPGWTVDREPTNWAAWVKKCHAEGAKYLVVVETTSLRTPLVAEFLPSTPPPIAKGPGWQLFRLP